MVELEIDLNQRIGEWDVIQESGSQLTPLYGPGYTGMRNLGNSCYMNSVMQVLFTIPDFQRRSVALATVVTGTLLYMPSSLFQTFSAGQWPWQLLSRELCYTGPLHYSRLSAQVSGLGNCCHRDFVIQALFIIPDFQGGSFTIATVVA